MIGPPWQPRRAIRWTGSRWSPSSAAPAALPPTLRVLTWNVLWDKYNPRALASHRRWPRLLDAALATRADLIALQEVTPAVHALVLDHPGVRAGWWVSHPRGHSDIGPYDLLWIGRHPPLSLGFLPLEARKGALAVALPGLVLCTTHLSSDHRTGAPRRRQSELDRIGAALAPPFAIVGDLNCETVQLPGSVDAWNSVHATPPAPTFDPTVNPLARHASRTGRPRHIDRMLLHGACAVSAHRIGTAPIDGLWPSDHAGVVFELQPLPAPAAQACPAQPPHPASAPIAPADAARLRRAVRGQEARYRSVLAAVEAWAVDAGVHPLLPPTAWAVLVAQVIATSPDATSAAVFARWAAWDWDQPVSLTGLVPVVPDSPLRILAPSDPTVVLTPHVDAAARARLEAALRAAAD